MSTATVAELAENQSFWVHTSPWFHRPRQARLEIPNKRYNGVHWNYGLSVREPKLIATGTSLAMWRFLRTSARIYWRGQYLLGSTDLVSSINLPLLWNRNDSTSRVGAQPYSLGVYPSPFPSDWRRPAHGVKAISHEHHLRSRNNSNFRVVSCPWGVGV